MALHEFGHVEADHRLFAAEEVSGQSLGEFGLTDTGRTGEDEAGDWAVGVLETNPGTAQGLGNGFHRFLTDQTLMEVSSMLSNFTDSLSVSF